jgi:hypothetical protein
MCLSPKEAVFKKPMESSQHKKSLYVRGHIDGRPISMMLVDDSAVINLMPNSILRSLRGKTTSS